MAMNARDADFFRPLWRRVLITAFVVAWFGYEVAFSHDSLWIAITAVALGYCVWNFFLRFPDEPPAPPPAAPPPAA
jgi:hypothetical protein